MGKNKVELTPTQNKQYWLGRMHAKTTSHLGSVQVSLFQEILQIAKHMNKKGLTFKSDNINKAMDKIEHGFSDLIAAIAVESAK